MPSQLKGNEPLEKIIHRIAKGAWGGWGGGGGDCRRRRTKPHQKNDHLPVDHVKKDPGHVNHAPTEDPQLHFSVTNDLPTGAYKEPHGLQGLQASVAATRDPRTERDKQKKHLIQKHHRV